MKFSFSRTGAILRKEFLQLKRDRATAAMVILFPLMQLLLFGYAINNDPKHLDTAVLSKDNSIFARDFIVGMKNSEYFCVDQEVTSEKEGRKLLQEGKVHCVITIPEHFARDLVRGKRPMVLLEADATDPIAVAGAIGAAPRIGAESLAKDLKGALSLLRPAADPFTLCIHKVYNPEGLTRYNIIPGLIGVLLTLMGMMVTAISLTRERERGTMENMLSMPVTPLEVMVGKIVPYIMICYAQAAVIVIFAYFLFEIPVLGNWGLLALALLAFIICNVALGFAISTMVRNQMQSIQVTMLVFLPSMLLSGFMFPFRGMPLWAQAIGSSVPITYFIRIARGILLKGSTFWEIWTNLWPLLLFMCITAAAAVRLYKKTLD
ncbi:MAG: ABC transporter permease [Holosporales bacterium]|nr:ABC transporter permease [Holosporales bacterium]